MAEAFPKSTFIGYDYHESSIACSRSQQSTSFDSPYQAPQQRFLGVFAQLCR
jgi:hypothetical protein